MFIAIKFFEYKFLLVRHLSSNVNKEDIAIPSFLAEGSLVDGEYSLANRFDEVDVPPSLVLPVAILLLVLIVVLLIKHIV